MTIYVDSSFLVSSCIQDANSSEALRRMRVLPSVWITPLNRSELAHAISQYVFRQTLLPAEAERAWNDFQQDCANGIWTLVNFPERTWEKCTDLARRYVSTLGVRTLDSLHVACALELRAEKFWTFDERQARLAEAVGLDTTP
ncbi:MAG: type II toxin-antitoxin system VapC family toxin [Terracidiphilus sp.]|nr:type II toxin-antitoxin system VapC family toxin [Terracidiphilus sp.]